MGYPKMIGASFFIVLFIICMSMLYVDYDFGLTGWQTFNWFMNDILFLATGLYLLISGACDIKNKNNK